MYIIIYIVNYNEYIVMYNIESHSLTITSTTWLNNVPHWYTNCKCTDKKALDEVQWGIEGGRTHSARLNPFFPSYTNVILLYIYIYIYIHTYVCAYIYTYTYTYTCRNLFDPMSIKIFQFYLPLRLPLYFFSSSPSSSSSSSSSSLSFLLFFLFSFC